MLISQGCQDSRWLWLRHAVTRGSAFHVICSLKMVLSSSSESVFPILSVDVVTKLIIIKKAELRKSGKKLATKKTIKNKDFVHIFALMKDNYLEFLNEILMNHYISKYKAREDWVFTCKIQVPPVKWVLDFTITKKLCSFPCFPVESARLAISKYLQSMKNWSKWRSLARSSTSLSLWALSKALLRKM